MQTPFKLSDSDRQFFLLVEEAAFANPFEDIRKDLDKQLAGLTKETAKDPIDQAIQNVAERIDCLQCEKQVDIRRYDEVDREILRSAILFDLFHRFTDSFDRLTLDQMQAGDLSCPVPFAEEALALFSHRSFRRDEAVRYLGIFYQLRRAFYFINRGLIGGSSCMKQLRSRLWSNVFTRDIRRYDRYLWDHMEDFSTLLLGETGTGKGAAAAAIGRSGFIPFDPEKGCFTESFMRSFVSLNLSQFPETLIESELFGHKKGAFTGAIHPHEGIFARCSTHGAIFLDEIGDLSVPVQIKLLQVLQERVFSPVGGHEKMRFAGRVIAATNKPLNELRRKGAFRDDFYYRLCSDAITVPPLRQRLEEDPKELPMLLRHLIRRLTGLESEEIVDTIARKLAEHPGPHYPWPGNVRELEQAVRRILLTDRYEGDHAAASVDLRSSLAAKIDSGTATAEEVLSSYCRILHERFGTYEKVAQRTGLDRRTVKKYVHMKLAKEQM